MPRFIPRSARLFGDRRGSVVTTFAISLVPLAIAAGVALDYANGVNVASKLQAAADAAALSASKTATDDASATEAATPVFRANYQAMARASEAAMTASFDSASSQVTVTGSVNVDSIFGGPLWSGSQSIKRVARAGLTAGPRYEACVMITEPTAGHTLLAVNNSRIDFRNCLVQVNTSNWDAVETHDRSYIHGEGGQNCFVGDIHFGDVSPPKNPSCAFFSDPFATLPAPAAASGACDYTNFFVVSPGATLSPGHYCKGLTINADATLSPGLYVIDGGLLKVGGSASRIVARGVTFYLTGSGAGFNMRMKSPATFDITPADASAAGAFADFLFYLDPRTTDSNGSTPANRVRPGPAPAPGPAAGGPAGRGRAAPPPPASDSLQAADTTGPAVANASVLGGVHIDTHGVIYLAGQQFQLTSGASLKLNTGSIIADFLLPNASTVDLTGAVDGISDTQKQLLKVGDGTGPPYLVR